MDTPLSTIAVVGLGTMGTGIAEVLARAGREVIGIDISEAEALAQVPRIRAFKEQHGKEPSINSANPIEKRMAEALAWIRAAAIRRQKEKDQAA